MTLFDQYNAKQSGIVRMNPPFVFIASMTYMALVDGEVHERELMSFAGWFVSDGEAEAACHNALKYARETAVGDFLMAAAPILTEEQKLCLLANMLDVLFADGFADPSEQELFYRFCDAFEVTEEQYRPFIQTAMAKNNRAVFLPS
ncbi:MAG: TerB family tellurite resistance protein [Myxococcota bacterium]